MVRAYGQDMIELLAPAGSMACLHAAVRGGADAVYLGLQDFNARRNADNFTLESLKEACEYAHLRGAKVFVALNIEIMPSELSRAVQVACDAYAAGADAFIIQDIGLARELAAVLPREALHASTQMNIHSAAGIEACALLGMGRVTLARELSLAEVADLAEVAASFGMQVEVFAHGALCVCYSGQCLMSSMIGGRSANRGLCAQACRLPYELHADSDEALAAPGEHLLSPKDLCTIDLLPDLIDAGVASLKIEGRMKSPEYVYAVVSVYRGVLDRVLAAQNDGVGSASEVQATPFERRQLEEAFSRGFTTAYLTGERGNDMMSYGRPNNRGVFVGRVASASQDVVTVSCEVDVHVGDVLEFWTNRGHFTSEVTSGDILPDGSVRLRVQQRVGKGDRVFRVRNAQMAFDDDAFEPRIPVCASVELVMGQPAHVSFALADPLWDTPTDVKGEAWGPIVEAARTKSLEKNDVEAHVDRLGQTPFVLVDMHVNLDEGVGMGFSQLHHLRADALDDLTSSMLAAYEQRRVAGKPALVESTALFESATLAKDETTAEKRASAHNASATEGSAPQAINRVARSRARECKVVAWVTNPACARAARRAGAEGIYVPALNYRRGQATLQGVRLDDADQAGYPKQCVMALPTVDHDPVGFAREACDEFDVWDYVREGRPVYVDSLSSLVRAQGMGALCEVGPHVPLVNKTSLEVAAAMGAVRAWLSPELTLGLIDELANDAPLDLGIVVAGYQELMICEHCLLMSQGPCAQQCATCPRRARSHHLTDRKGFDFPVITDMWGRSHLFNGVELDIVASLPDLIDAGISAIMVDATFMDARTTSDAVGRAIRARDMARSEHRSVTKRPGTTTGHLFRGVS